MIGFLANISKPRQLSLLNFTETTVAATTGGATTPAAGTTGAATTGGATTPAAGTTGAATTGGATTPAGTTGGEHIIYWLFTLCTNLNFIVLSTYLISSMIMPLSNF